MSSDSKDVANSKQMRREDERRDAIACPKGSCSQMHICFTESDSPVSVGELRISSSRLFREGREKSRCSGPSAP